jgi:ribonuclease D
MPDEKPQSDHARHVADYRRRHRRQQHEEAHASPVDHHDHAPSHGLAGVFSGKPEVIETQAALDALIARLRDAGTFAYDTEFIGEMSYRPQVCLIQVATDDYVGLIDPLAGVELSEFWGLLADGSLHKVVHAGQQDLEHVWRAIGQPPGNVLDTQIAGGFIGLGYPASLAKLVLEFTDIKLHKGFTFTDWTIRPLSASQLKYAADDVRFLLPIAADIRARLAEVNRLEWAMAECESLCIDGKPGFDAETAWHKVRGGGSLDGRGINVLKLLVAWREACAETADVPPRTYLKDEVLVDLCRTRPKSFEKLQNIRHLPRPVIERAGRDLLEMVERGLAMPPAPVDNDPGGEPRLSEKFELDAMWSLAQTICLGRGLDPQLVTSRQDATDVYRKLRRGRDASDERLMTGWRAEALGNDLRSLAAGAFDARATWRKGRLTISDDPNVDATVS